MEERQERRRRIWESKRAAWYARAPLPGLYGNVGQIYHSGLTVQFSYLPRAACRSTPNHPRALQGRMEAEATAAATVSAGELLVNEGGIGGSGAEAPDRGSANTLLPPPFSYLTSPHLSPQPALPIEPSSTPSSNILARPSPSSTSANVPRLVHARLRIQQDDELPGKTERNAKLQKYTD